MHKVSLTATVILTGLATLASCQNNELKPQELSVREEATLSINLEDSAFDTKVTVTPTEANDKKLNNLAIFVFRADDGRLDASLVKTSGVSATGISIKTSTGTKNIYVVANYHGTDWSSITSESQFKALASDVKHEGYDSFTMVGKKLDYTPKTSEANDLNISICRLVARIKLSSVKADFSGTSYAGSSLTDLRLYITNVVGSVMYHDGFSLPSTPVIYHQNGHIADDDEGTQMLNTFYDYVEDSIASGSTHSTPHYFYAYQNNITDESSRKFTRLVIEGKLNGHVYYWPININQANFNGTNTANGIMANHVYDYAVTITRPGSDSPEDLVTTAQCSVSLTILPWTENKQVSTEF